MTTIPFPASSAPGVHPHENGGRLINCYAAEAEGAAAHPVLWTRSAGLRRIVATPSAGACRGLVQIGSTLVHLPRDRAYGVAFADGGFAATELGPLAGSAPVTIAQNFAKPVPDTVCVTENGVFTLTSASAPAAFGDGDLSAPNSVTALDGYLVFTSPGGRIQTTGLNTLSVASNAYEDVPEGALVRGVTFNNELFAFGPSSFRVYRDAGLTPFPLAYTGVKRDIGLLGTHAVAGFEDGWPDALVFAASDNRVYRMEGYSPVAVSTAAVARAIGGASDRAALQASVHMAAGEAFWTLTSPDEWSWEYNLSTGLWNERASYRRNDWRARRTIRAFDRWIAGDAADGTLAEIVPGLGGEYDDPLIFTLQSGILAAFPGRLNALRSWFRFSAGVGSAAGRVPIETEPVVRIAWSRDGGATFGNGVDRQLGGQGDHDALVGVGASGLSDSRGLQVRLTVSDPVRAAFMGGEAVIATALP